MKPRGNRKKRERKLSYDEQAFFCRQMAFVVQAGIPPANAREFLRKNGADEKRPDRMDPVFTAMAGGESFAAALRRSGLFSDYLAAAAELGESTGSLDRALEELADHYDSAAGIRRELRSAFAYPLILLTMMLAVILFLIVEMLPQFSSILIQAGGQMPAAAAGLMEFGRFLRAEWGWLIAAAGILALTGRLFFRSRPGRAATGRFLLHSRLCGRPTRLLATARFCSAMRMALSCGNSFADAVRMAAGMAENPAVKARLAQLADRAAHGDIPAAVARAGLFPEPFVRLFATAYRTGNLEETMEKMAAYYTEKFDSAVNSVTARIEPGLVIGLSAAAGVVLFSVMLPIIHIMQSIG